MSRSRLTNFLRSTSRLIRTNRRFRKSRRSMKSRLTNRTNRFPTKSFRLTNRRLQKIRRLMKNLRSKTIRLKNCRLRILTNRFPKILRSTSYRLSRTNCFLTKSSRSTYPRRPNYCRLTNCFRLTNYRSTNRSRSMNYRLSRTNRCFRNLLSVPGWPVFLCLRIRLSSRRMIPSCPPRESARLLFRPRSRRPIFRACLL